MAGVPGVATGVDQIKAGDVLFDRVEAELQQTLAVNAEDLAQAAKAAGIEDAGTEEAGAKETTVDEGAQTLAEKMLEQRPLGDTPTGEEETVIDEEQGDDEVKSVKKGKETPPPDKDDPQYKKALKAEESLNKILTDNNYDSLDDLIEDLKTGKSLKELIGDEDAEQLVTDAKTKRAWEAHWAAEKEKAQRENETPEETLARQDKEIAELKKARQEDIERKGEIEKSKEAIKVYHAEVDRVLETEDLGKEEKSLIKLIMGVDNPALVIEDITDRSTVRTATKDINKRISTLIGKIKQQAIDDYVQGKKGALKVSKTTAAPPSTSVKKPEFKGKTEGAILDEAKSQLIEILTGGSH